MIFRPIVSLWVLAIFFIACVALCVWGARRRAMSSRVNLVRRLLIVSLMTFMLAGPSIKQESHSTTSDVELWFVIDRTGSMAAEDYGPDRLPRLDGVKADVATIVDHMPAARFSIFTWDRDIERVLPVTSDIGAIDSYMQIMGQELSSSSQGSSLARPVSDLRSYLTKAQESRGGNSRYVVVMGDGENTEDASQGVWDWRSVAEACDGALVIGYGTAEGGRMKARSLDQSQSGYIPDPQDPSRDGISSADEGALREVASQLGADYVHSPDNGSIIDHAAQFNSEGKLISESRDTVEVYRYYVWPFALVFAVLLAWEASAIVARMRKMRRAHVI